MFDLKRWVIQPAVDDVNQCSNLWVKWSQRKTGHRVTHLQFQFGEKNPPPVAKTLAASLQTERVGGIPKREIEKLAHLGETYEQAAQRIVRERRKAGASPQVTGK